MATRLRKPTDADRKRVDRLLETLSRRDCAALRRCLAWNDETIPRHQYSRLSGRDARVLCALAERYGLPVDGETVDLAAVLDWFHSFLAENGRKLLAVSGDDPMTGPTSPALEKWREEKYLLARITRLEKEAELLPREMLHTTLSTLASILRKGVESIRKHFGSEAAEVFSEILDDCEREIDSLLSGEEELAG